MILFIKPWQRSYPFGFALLHRYYGSHSCSYTVGLNPAVTCSPPPLKAVWLICHHWPAVGRLVAMSSYLIDPSVPIAGNAGHWYWRSTVTPALDWLLATATNPLLPVALLPNQPCQRPPHARLATARPFCTWNSADNNKKLAFKFLLWYTR